MRVHHRRGSDVRHPLRHQEDVRRWNQRRRGRSRSGSDGRRKWNGDGHMYERWRCGGGCDRSEVSLLECQCTPTSSHSSRALSLLFPSGSLEKFAALRPHQLETRTVISRHSVSYSRVLCRQSREDCESKLSFRCSVDKFTPTIQHLRRETSTATKGSVRCSLISMRLLRLCRETGLSSKIFPGCTFLACY